MIESHEANHRNIIFEIADVTVGAVKDLRANSRNEETYLPRAVAERLTQRGYFTTASAKEISQDFGARVDLVAWKTSFRQPIAVVFEHGLADERILELDSFNPAVRIPDCPLLKLFIAVQLPGGLRPGSSVTDAYFYGLAGTTPRQEKPAEPEPF